MPIEIQTASTTPFSRPTIICVRKLRTSRFALLAVLGLASISAACSSSSTSSSSAPSAGQAIGQPSPFLSGNLSVVGCGGTALCAAAGASFDPSPKTPVIAGSTDSGIHWVAGTTSAPATITINGVSCSVKSCLALGFSGLNFQFLQSANARSWETIPTTPLGGNPQAVGCAQTKWCLVIVPTAAGFVATATTTAGKQWTTPTPLPPGIGQVRTLTCSASTSCISTGIDPNGKPQVLLTSSGNSGWAIANLPSTATEVLSAACRSDGICFAIVRNGIGQPTQLTKSSAGSTAFVNGPTIPNLASPSAVACSSTTCVFGGSNKSGAAVLASQTGHSAPQSIGVTFAPTGIVALSCGAPTQCVAITTSSLIQVSPLVPQRSK